MNSIVEVLSADHRSCDHLFAAADRAAADNDWSSLKQALERFVQAMERHFHHEETALFPAMEARAGANLGPTSVMRLEHNQMRELFHAMAQAARAHDAGDYMGLSETLLIMMHQHNAREEQVLYPMGDQLLGEQAGPLARRLSRAPAAGRGDAVG